MIVRGGVKRDDADLIINILDRAVHPSTSDIDVIQSINGIRRIVKALCPSQVLRPDDEDDLFRPEDFIQLRQDYDRAVCERDGMVQENKKITTTLKQKDALLTRQTVMLLEKDALVAKLQSQIDAFKIDHQARIDATSGEVVDPPLDKASYTYSEVMSIIWMRFGKMNGALKSLASYNALLREKDPSIPTITDTTVQVWRRQNAYPAWAVDQLRDLKSITKGRLKWTPEHIAFLRDTYKSNPTQSDEELACKCTREFKFDINTNSVKTKLYALRASNEIPMRHRS